MMGLYGADSRRGRTVPHAREHGHGETAPVRESREANALGVAYVPADRRKGGILLPH